MMPGHGHNDSVIGHWAVAVSPEPLVSHHCGSTLSNSALVPTPMLSMKEK
jgi:hypothetical protein